MLSTASMMMVGAMGVSQNITVPMRNNLLRTPPMGWMSWEIFRCNIGSSTDDCTDPATTHCISAALIEGQADALVSGGFLAAGYTRLSIDDCWPNFERDPTTNNFVANTTRFPGGIGPVADYLHEKGIQLGMYTAESTTTCGGYPGSKGYEQQDAKFFADNGVDYLKVDGCGDNDYYPTGYQLMGQSLLQSGANIAYSCSWPAYIQGNESVKPFGTFINDACNLWRNWDDVQCSWDSVSSIINYFWDNQEYLIPFHGPGHFHDADMYIGGNGCITTDEERTHFAFLAQMSAPLILGNDLRNISAESAAIILNQDAIAINQDPLVQMGRRIDDSSVVGQRWVKGLADGSTSVAFVNMGATAPQPPIPYGTCPLWNQTTNGYYEACGGANGDLGQFSGLTTSQAQTQCCNNPLCAGFSFEYDSSGVTGGGFWKANAMCGFVTLQGALGFTKAGQVPNPGGAPLDISLNFSEIYIYSNVTAYDIWNQKSLGTFSGSFTASQVPYHGNTFIKFTPIPN